MKKKTLYKFFWCFTMICSGVFASGESQINASLANQGVRISELGTPSLFTDDLSPGQLSSSEALDLAETQLEKTLAIAFTTNSDVTSRQVIFEQGGGTRGFNMVIEDQQLYLNAWSFPGGGDGDRYAWGFKTLAANIAPNTEYTATLVLKGAEDFTGTFTAYLNGERVGDADGVGPLRIHNNGIGVGLNHSYTRINYELEHRSLPFTGDIQRLAQFNQAVTPLQYLALDNLMGNAHHQQSPSYNLLSPVLLLDSPAIGTIDNTQDINENSMFMAKTLAIHFVTGSDVTTRQVLFEQGGGWRGMNMFIEDQQLHMNVYSRDGGEELWGYKTVSIDIAPNIEYNGTLVMQSQQDWSGSLTGYLNGVHQGSIGGIGPLLRHANDIGVGDIADHTTLANEVVDGSYPFLGQLKQVAEFNQALTADEVALLAEFTVDTSTPNTIQATITAPQTLTTVGYSPIMVTGHTQGQISELTLNGVPVTPANDGSFSAPVALTQGFNTIVARATNDEGIQVTDSISISLDLTPPYLTIDSHTPSQIVYTETVTVTGLVNDIVRGTVEAQQAVVDVNGVQATVSNRSYAAQQVPVVEGNNLLTITAVDQAGNSTSITQNVIYQRPSARNISVVGGQDQTASIGAKTAEFLQVLVTDEQGDPVANETLVFRVIQGAGVVGAESEHYGRAIVTQTNQQGVAQTLFQLGYRTGVANHKVRAQVVGYQPEVIFHASAHSTIGNKISINSGNNQRGIAGQNLPAPLVIVVTDSGANVVSNARVMFEVMGDGSLGTDENGEPLSKLVQVTDSDGRATVQYTLGQTTGLDRQRIKATLLDAPEGQTLTAVFMATAFVAGEPGLTSVSGAVLDNQDQPIANVTIRVEGTDRSTSTDSQGRFKLAQVPVGPVHIIADGSTAAVSGEFPTLSYHLVTVPGVDNPLSAPIYMVKLDTDHAVYAGPEDVSLTLPEFPGFQLDIAKDAITFPDGSREGLVSVTAVNASKVPMAPPNGMQPQFIVTIQPVGATFDPPAKLSLPNVDGHAPGAQVEMYSFDHDLEEFVAIGLGTVSEDGSQVRSNVGVGVVKAGWHCGSQPGGSGTVHNCATCFKCENGDCVKDDAQRDTPFGEQQAGDCKTKTCSGEKDDENDPPTADMIRGDCKKPGCDGGTPNQDGRIDDNDVPSEDPQEGDCKKRGCANGEIVDVADLTDIKPEDEVCKFCGTEGELKNKPDGMPIEGQPCKECQAGNMVDINGDIQGVPCQECQGGVRQNKPDGTSIADDACKECRNGQAVPNFDSNTEQRIVQFIANPGISKIADKLNQALKHFNISKNFEVSPEADLILRDADCCSQASGPIKDGYTEGEGTTMATVGLPGLTIWGPPTVSREVDFGMVTIDIDFEFGVKVDTQVFARLYGGQKNNKCENEGCFYAGTESGFEINPKAIAEAVLCTVTAWTDEYCAGISVTPASLVIKVSGSVGYNLTCGEGISGSLLLGEVIFQAQAFPVGVPDAVGFTYTKVIFAGKTI